MWYPLSEFKNSYVYDYDATGDWSPMREIVPTLMCRSYAPFVNAFTSLHTLVITTAPEYGKLRNHDAVSISYNSARLSFSVAYADPRNQQQALFTCHRSQVLSLVDALVLRLSIASTIPPEARPITIEDAPTFQVGDSVRVVLNDRNTTPRTGTVCEVVRHVNKKRYLYYLLADGKRVKKRYYSNDLIRA